MAADTTSNSPAPASNPVLPPYPELIFAAIEALDNKKGANKSSISKQIESIYGNLPAAHSTILSHHLNKLKATGELIMVKNNYVKPDPNAPPRRGRGRPPKPKSDDVSDTKQTAPLVSGRKRGRPAKLIEDDASATEPVTEPAPVAGEKRGRGRPPKVKLAFEKTSF